MRARVNTGPHRLQAPGMLRLRLQKGLSFRCVLSSVLFELDSENRADPGKGDRLRHELMTARDLVNPDLARDMGPPGVRRWFLSRPIGGRGKKQQVASELTWNKTGCQEMIVPGHLVHCPDVVLL